MKMDNTINGRTPDEIKKGLELCGKDPWCVASECPYYEIHECHTYLAKDAYALNQQLERERDAAVEQLKEVDTRDLFSCSHCKNEEFSVCEFVDCENCDKDCPCATCVDMSNWQWRGVQNCG